MSTICAKLKYDRTTFDFVLLLCLRWAYHSFSVKQCSSAHSVIAIIIYGILFDISSFGLAKVFLKIYLVFMQRKYRFNGMSKIYSYKFVRQPEWHNFTVEKSISNYKDVVANIAQSEELLKMVNKYIKYWRGRRGEHN